ncbi:unnamed protein product [Eruca vesicaria subsp. sativa]|uniref:Uncharacterized protein n=1 Tax=Eruca vesicaria subsp. sativa TaxID=29727 RepID=A0ABC8LLC6_ERUVS|nr:unnamed protein product [Eruca vesicaria subsp. sativa]
MDAPSNELRKGAWTAEEDFLLRKCIDMYGEGKWHLVPSRSGLYRCRKSCRLRWLNYLKPSIKRGKLSSDEVDLLSRLHKLLGNRWSLIAGRLPGRTANDVKNYWNTHMSKKSYPSCKSEIKEGNSSSSAAIPASKANVRKPQPRSFANNNSLSGVNCLPEVDIDDSITCTKDEENVMDGDNMWWESLLKEDGGVDTVDPTAMATDEAGTSLMNSSSSMFDIDKLWSLFNEETKELD